MKYVWFDWIFLSIWFFQHLRANGIFNKNSASYPNNKLLWQYFHARDSFRSEGHFWVKVWGEGGNLQPAFKNINMHIVKHNSAKKSLESCFSCNWKSKIIFQISNFLHYKIVYKDYVIFVLNWLALLLGSWTHL